MKMCNVWAKIRIAVFVCITTVVLSGICHADPQGELNRAKEFLKATMYDQAVITLNNLIDKKPSLAEAHFLLGKAYLYKHNYDDAKTAFNRATSINSSFGFKTGEAYFEVAKFIFSNNDYGSANYLFQEAAANLPKLKDNISDIYYKKGSGPDVTIDAKINFFGSSLRYSSKHRTEITKYSCTEGDALLSRRDVHGVTLLSACMSLDSNKKDTVVNNMVSAAQSQPINIEVFSAAYNKLLDVNRESAKPLLALISANKDKFVAEGNNSIVEVLLKHVRIFNTDSDIASEIIFGIAKLELNQNNMPLFAQHYEQADSLNKKVSADKSSESSYYYGVYMFYKGNKKETENEMLKLIRNEPSSNFIKKLQELLAPSGGVAYLQPGEKKEITKLFHNTNLFYLSSGKCSVVGEDNKGFDLGAEDGIYYSGIKGISREGGKIYFVAPVDKSVTVFYVFKDGISYKQ